MKIRNDNFWLNRRLSELGKTKIQLSEVVGINVCRLSELAKGNWRFQAAHIRKVAEFLEFDCLSFLDFVSGNITEDQLWNAKSPIKITKEELNLLEALKAYTLSQTTSEPPEIEVSLIIQTAGDKKK